MEKTLITLPTFSWQMLKEVLVSPGWATTPPDIFIAGRIDEEERIAVPPYPPQPVSPEIDLAWKQAPYIFGFTAKEMAVIKTCIEFNLGRGSFFANQYSAALLRAFGVGDTP
jgi:hypothetical protein